MYEGNNRDNSPEENNNSSKTLFSRVASIIEQARTNTVRAVNSNMVLCYWFIGREIVKELQEEKERAEYGIRLLEELSDNEQKVRKRIFKSKSQVIQAVLYDIS